MRDWEDDNDDITRRPFHGFHQKNDGDDVESQCDDDGNSV